MQGLDADRAIQDGDDLAERLEAVIFTGFEQGLDADALATAVLQASEPRQSLHPEDGERALGRWWTLGGYNHLPQTFSQTVALAQPDPALIVAMLTPQAAEAAA